MEWNCQYLHHNTIAYFFVFSFRFENQGQLWKSYFLFTKDHEEMKKVFSEKKDLIDITQKYLFIISE